MVSAALYIVRYYIHCISREHILGHRRTRCNARSGRKEGNCIVRQRHYLMNIVGAKVERVLIVAMRDDNHVS